MAELIDSPLADAFREGADAERRELGANSGRDYVTLRAQMHQGNFEHFMFLAEQAAGRAHAAQEWLTKDDQRRAQRLAMLEGR